jgi:hypothetical protein
MRRRGERYHMKLDLKNFNHQLIITGMTNLVDKGTHPREVLDLLDDIKNQTFFALMDIYRERKNENPIN